MKSPAIADAREKSEYETKTECLMCLPKDVSYGKMIVFCIYIFEILNWA